MTFVRLFADCTGSAVSSLALGYMRSMMRLAPVRLVPVTPLDGPWGPYLQLLATPMIGDLINVVACDPSRWAWRESIPVPKSDVAKDADFNPEAMVEPVIGETIVGTIELHTAFAKRNVLLTLGLAARTPMQIATAQKYDVIVDPDQAAHVRTRATICRTSAICQPGVVDVFAMATILGVPVPG